MVLAIRSNLQTRRKGSVGIVHRTQRVVYVSDALHRQLRGRELEFIMAKEEALMNIHGSFVDRWWLRDMVAESMVLNNSKVTADVAERALLKRLNTTTLYRGRLSVIHLSLRYLISVRLAAVSIAKAMDDYIYTPF